MPKQNDLVVFLVVALVGAALALSAIPAAQAQQAPCNPAVQTCT